METTIYHEKIASGHSTTKNEAYKVFIVEDSYPNQLMLENFLETMPNCPKNKKPNLEIHSFSSGEQCMANMDMQPDIVILDFYLNESNANAMNGLDVLNQIKAKYPSTKVIIMSGQDSVIVTAELFHQGASDYVAKEHYGITRVGQSVLRLIAEIEKDKKRSSTIIINGIILFAVGLIIGLLI